MRAANRDDLRSFSYGSTSASSFSGARSIAVHDPQKAIGIDLVLEFSQEAVGRQHEAIGALGADVARVEHLAGRVDRRLHERRRQLVLAQQGLERRLARDEGLDDAGFDGEDGVGPC